SEKTFEMVQEQLRERYGDDVADEFDASKDAMPYTSWLSFGYRVRPKERSLKSITFVEVLNDKGEVERKVKRTCNIFHRKQVEKIA
ncbi:MAG: hypothetical protein NT077_01260, partial [Candidatus Taylorbacteria bacterium]|nr:hypothetical protein [Candidatus Taylorbacteria bacterium]